MNHKAVIFKHGQEYGIAGGQVAIEKGDTVQFYNSSGGHADVLFADESLPDRVFELKNGDMHPKKFEKDGWYEYSVTVTVHEGKEDVEYLVEASRPIVIVYP